MTDTPREAVLWVKDGDEWREVSRVTVADWRVVNFLDYFTEEEVNPGATVAVSLDPPPPLGFDDFSGGGSLPD